MTDTDKNRLAEIMKRWVLPQWDLPEKPPFEVAQEDVVWLLAQLSAAERENEEARKDLKAVNEERLRQKEEIAAMKAHREKTDIERQDDRKQIADLKRQLEDMRKKWNTEFGYNAGFVLEIVELKAKLEPSPCGIPGHLRAEWVEIPCICPPEWKARKEHTGQCSKRVSYCRACQREQSERAAVVEECCKAVENAAFPVYAGTMRAREVRKMFAAAIRALVPTDRSALEKVKRDARLEEAEWWEQRQAHRRCIHCRTERAKCITALEGGEDGWREKLDSYNGGRPEMTEAEERARLTVPCPNCKAEFEVSYEVISGHAIQQAISQAEANGRRIERETLKTAVRILMEMDSGAAVNAIREDYPELAELMEQVQARTLAAAAKHEPIAEHGMMRCTGCTYNSRSGQSWADHIKGLKESE